MPGVGRAEQAHRLTIIVPVYNEAENFPSLWSALNQQVTADFDVIVVYDFDEDNTVPVAQQLIDSGQSNLRLTRNNIRKGVVGAIVSGFRQIESGPVLVAMADSSDDLRLVDKMLELYNLGYDVVVGSRYMKGGQIINGPWFKQGLSRLAGITLYHFRGVPTHDICNSFKIYDASMLRQMKIESTAGFEINIEIAVKAFLSGRKIAEVPATWREREHGTSRFSLWRWLPHYLRWYFYAFQPKWQDLRTTESSRTR